MNGMKQALAKLGIAGLIGGFSVGGVLFLVVYGAIHAGADSPIDPTLLGALSQDAAVVLMVGAGAAIANAVSQFGNGDE